MSPSAQNVTADAALLRRADLLQRAGLGHVVALEPLGAVAPDAHLEPLGQRVDDGDADAVQTTGDAVALAVELPARVQDGHDHLEGGPLLHRVHVDREAAAVVLDPDAAVGQQGDPDGVAVAGQRLVDGVVHDLPHHVVQAALTGGTDVHTGALADRLEPLEDGDGTAGVGVLGLRLGRATTWGLSFAQPAPSQPRWTARGRMERRTALSRLLAVSVVHDTGWTDRNPAVHGPDAVSGPLSSRPPPPVLPRGLTRRPRGADVGRRRRAGTADRPDTRVMSPPARAAPAKTCLVTGATGYIGGRLVPELLAAGHRVRVMTRSPERLRDHPWADQVEIVAGRRRPTPSRWPPPAPGWTSSTT